MIKGCDSSGFHPTLAQLQQAYADGVRVWGLYLPGHSIYSGDTADDVDRIHAAGMVCVAYASGNENPAQQKALAQSWGVDWPCLDVEGGIRADGPWVQPWLDASGFGLYGNLGVHGGRKARFHVLADYPVSGDPKATWYGPRPTDNAPCAWQWHGTITAYGGSVDLSWWDDDFATQGGDDLTPEHKAFLVRMMANVIVGRDPRPASGSSAAEQDYYGALIKDDGSNLEDVFFQFRTDKQNEIKNGSTDELIQPLASHLGGSTATHRHDVAVDDAAGHPVTVTSGPPK